jgi:DNA-binding MarR family transcriptional regulator
MEKTEYTVQEAYVIETIFKKPNIKQIDLASHCLISSRILRKVINSIRKKGWITNLRQPLFGWLVITEGYSLRKKKTAHD